MMTLANKLRMLEEMRKIASGMRSISMAGICENLAVGTGHSWYGWGTPEDYFNVIKERACRTWAHFSGDLDYPVSHPWFGGACDASFAFDNLPAWEGEYGRCRYELCERIIKEIKRDLSKNHRSQRRSHQLGKKKRK